MYDFVYDSSQYEFGISKILVLGITNTTHDSQKHRQKVHEQEGSNLALPPLKKVRKSQILKLCMLCIISAGIMLVGYHNGCRMLEAVDREPV